MSERLQNVVEIKTNGAAVVSDETQSTTASPSDKKELPCLADYVNRVRKMKNGVCFDQPWLNPTPVKPAKKEGPSPSEKDKEKEPKKATPDR